MMQDERLLLKQKFLEYFSEVPIQKYAAAYIGRTEDTITDWKKQDSDFSDQIEFAKAEYLRRSLKEVKSKEWILERLFKDHFSDDVKSLKDKMPNITYITPSWFQRPGDAINNSTEKKHE